MVESGQPSTADILYHRYVPFTPLIIYCKNNLRVIGHKFRAKSASFDLYASNVLRKVIIAVTTALTHLSERLVRIV